MKDGEKLFKLIQKMHIQINVPDLHSFMAKVNDGIVFVEARLGDDIFIRQFHSDGKITEWAGTVMAATNRLEMLGIDFNSIDM